MQKLIRITTVPLSLEKLLEGQLTFMQQFYDVTAISAEKERLEKYGKENKVKTFWVEMTREITPVQDLKALLKLYRFFKKEKPFIVHTHTPKAGILGMLAAKMAGVPHRLHTVAGMPLLETVGTKRRILDQVEKLTYSSATKIYPNSKGLQKIILKENFAAPEKLKVLGKGSSNGIDTSYFNPENFSDAGKIELKTSLGISLEDLVFIFVGRMVADKGVNELVKAFVALQKKYKNSSLLLVGPFEQHLDPLEEPTFDLIEKHSKIYSVGYQEDVRPCFSISDVLAFPSYREGFPNVVMQAGAMGIPLIVTNINGCNEIVEEGENGVIIPVKDEKSLENAMTKFIEAPGWKEKLKSSARRKITSNYERASFWKLLLKEYKNLRTINN